MLLTITIIKGWFIRQLDVRNVFLHGIFQENVSLKQPFGFEIKGSQPLVCHLKKAFYGFKQSPRATYEKLSLSLNSLGFRTSKADISL